MVAVLLMIAGWAAGHSVTAAQMPSAQAPQLPASQGPGGSPPFDSAPDPNDPMVRQRMEKMEKARNTQRQEQLQRDTDKLFDLAKELKDQVDKSNKDTLSIDVVKKAAEIEKLAKSVKDRMRG